MRLLVITANDIDQAGITFEQALPADWLDAELAESGAKATAPGGVKARLSRSGKSDIVVRGDCHAELELPCARCLKPTAVSVTGELSLLLKVRVAPPEAPRGQERRSSRGVAAPPPNGAKGAKGAKAAARVAEYEFSSEEADLDEYDGDHVVLDAFVREALLLELPNFPLCSDGCPGISRTPRRGEAIPAEPVRVNPFEALKHLRPSLGSSHVGDAASEGSGENGISDFAGDHGPHAEPRPANPPKIETKIASTHAAPLRPTARQKRLKKIERPGKSSLTKRRKRT
ncbi:MAG: DUF177 domain-containing protein [Polyangiaceae bacterium]